LTAKRRAQRGLDSGHASAKLLRSGNTDLLCGSIPIAAESVLRYSKKLAESRRNEAGNAMTWTAVEFENWRSTVPDPQKRKRAWNDLSNDQKKEVKELRTFIGFCRAAGSDVDPRTIENRKPPEPDIYCELSGHGQFYELGELTDERIPRNAAEAQRASSNIHGGSYSSLEPLRRMVFQKCAKQPRLNGIPAEIVLHFSVSHMVPSPPMLAAFLAENGATIKAGLTACAFSRIWFYDEWSGKVLAVVERE
jgi:hypothetical protein